MEYKIKDLISYIEAWAKPEYQEAWDNSGPQVLFKEEKTKKVLLALDFTDKVVEEAIEEKAKLIISHHPMFFEGIKSIEEGTYIGNNIIKLIENRISLYSAHTSLDIAEEGVNHTLCEILGLKDYRGLSKTDKGYYLGLISENNDYNLETLYKSLKDKLETSKIKIYGVLPKKIERIAICGGSGFSLIDDVIENKADIFITGDVKHHDSQKAYENGICLIDISHYYGERPVLNKIKKNLKNNFDIEVLEYLKNDFEIEIH
ncbi:Nif3-like dinuclear metal center hexameric protein [Peptoniphilus catoniae]|uniref:Nif3-like dinuclear metal center hexameric protein n=1 Tax=Peptoniphilus catoniae TaxID=1660341 RepID=UPI0010FF4ECB|nr:Nif3-like dinuclear metal center hexameric protein [Peptoniphilus catoniae]